MITFKHPEHHRAPPEAMRPEPLETDPVAIIARAMVEYEYESPDADDLAGITSLSRAEIEANGDRARDLANKVKREHGGWRPAA